ncbi:MAG TPA: hypothetical protein VFB66_03550, partial [Tepidisphaeraceae bacterium]|nr:hypothetical protein [Tepidisphaeraceae bacterium]
MEYQEVILARTLLHDLEAALSPAGPAEVSIRECGANSSCTARRGERSCRVNCFHYDFRSRHGPEYQVCFFRGEQMESCGRTPADADAVRAVCDWLAGATVEALNDRHAFVDRHRRTLTRLASTVLATSPELRQSVAHELRDRGWDDCELTFARGDRSCNLSFYGDNLIPNAVFRWDQTPMFALPA